MVVNALHEVLYSKFIVEEEEVAGVVVKGVKVGEVGKVVEVVEAVRGVVGEVVVGAAAGKLWVGRYVCTLLVKLGI